MTLILAAVGYGIAGAVVALSILLGGSVCCISNSLYIWLYFYRHPAQRSARSILRTAYWAELSKLLLTAVLLVTVLTAVDSLNVLVFFAAFFLSQLVYWVAPPLVKN